MLEMASRLAMDFCFRCGEQIKSPEDLSVDHKVDWIDSPDPIQTFFDVGNLAFSHRHCNRPRHRSKCPNGHEKDGRGRCAACQRKANLRYWHESGSAEKRRIKRNSQFDNYTKTLYYFGGGFLV